MNSGRTDLAAYDNSWFKPGGSALSRLLWYGLNACFFKSAFPFSGFKVALLKLFGAKVGKGVVIKPHVNIKYPWNLRVGNHTWIGENVWIDNLAAVTVGSNCCISQGSFILTGNHDYTKATFDLMVKPAVMEDGSWLGARSVLCPGVTMKSHSVLAVGSVAVTDLDAYGIYQGIPAVKVRERNVRQ